MDGELETLERYKIVKNFKEIFHNIIRLQRMWYTASTVKETVTDQMVDTILREIYWGILWYSILPSFIPCYHTSPPLSRNFTMLSYRWKHQKNIKGRVEVIRKKTEVTLFSELSRRTWLQLTCLLRPCKFKVHVFSKQDE